MSSSAMDHVGKEYSGGTWTVRQEDFQAYAAATDDPNPAYAGASGIAPPMFHVRPFIDLMLSMANDPDLEIDVLRLVHGEHAMRFERPLRDGDVLELGGSLLGVEPKASGTVYTFSLHADAGGVRVLEGRTVYFVRAPRKPDAPRAKKAPPVEPPPPHWTADQPVSDDQALRYARASGDGNPIHTDDAVAKKAGLPRPILHGLCTLAFAARDLVDRSADRDPARLESISVRWARPVLPGDTLTLQVWEQGPTELEFRTLGPDGKPVLVAGRATLRSA